MEYAKGHTNIELFEVNDRELRESLRDRIIDIGISVESDVTSRFNSFILQEEKVILAVPKILPINKRLTKYAISFNQIRKGDAYYTDIPCVSMSNFSKSDFVLLKQGNDMRMRAEKICCDAGFTPHIIMEMDQLI